MRNCRKAELPVKLLAPRARIGDAGIQIGHMLQAEDRFQRPIQCLANAMPACAVLYINRQLNRPVIGGTAFENARISVSDRFTIQQRDKIRITFERVRNPCREILECRHVVFKRDCGVFHIGLIDCEQRSRI